MTLTPKSTPAEIAAALREALKATSGGVSYARRAVDEIVKAIDPPPRMVTLTVRADDAQAFVTEWGGWHGIPTLRRVVDAARAALAEPDGQRSETVLRPVAFVLAEQDGQQP